MAEDFGLDVTLRMDISNAARNVQQMTRDLDAGVKQFQEYSSAAKETAKTVTEVERATAAEMRIIAGKARALATLIKTQADLLTQEERLADAKDRKNARAEREKRISEQNAEAARREASAWHQLVKAVEEVNKAYRKGLREDAVGGTKGRNFYDISQGEIDALKEVRQIQGADVVRQSDDLTAARERLNTALRKANYAEMARDGNALAAAELRLKDALEAQSTAQQNLKTAQANRDIFGEIKATQDLAAAVPEVAAAQDHLAVETEKAATATEQLRQSQEGMQTNLPRQRYALYDLAAAYTTVSAILLGGVTATTTFAAKYETSFTKVARTTGLVGNDMNYLRQEIIGMSQEIPETVNNLADLAARAAQVGIASGEIAEFTETISKFVATSDTVTLEQAVESIARLANITGYREWERLGSAITLVGVNSAATEAQIIKSAQEIAPFGQAAGLAADEIVALAAATQSLGQAPERTRSALQALTFTMDRAVGGINDLLPAYANLLKMSEEATASLWQQDPGEFIQALARALSATDNMTLALSELGLTERRAAQVFGALAGDARNAAGGVSVLERAFDDARRGAEEGTEMNRQYSLVLDTLESQLQITANILENIAATVGGPFAEALKFAVSNVNGLLAGLEKFAKSPIGSALTTVAGGLAIVVGGFAALRAAMALSRASLFAYLTAVHGADAIHIRTMTTAKMFALSLFGVKTSADGATVSLNGTAIAARAAAAGMALLRAVPMIAAISAVTVAVMALVDAFTSAEDRATALFGPMSNYTDALAKDAQEFANTGEAITVFWSSTERAAGAAKELEVSGGDLATVMEYVEESSKGAATELERVSLVVGENFLNAIKNSLVASDKFANVIDRLRNQDLGDFAVSLGLNIDELLEASIKDGQSGAQRYLVELFRVNGGEAGRAFAEAFDENGMAGAYAKIQELTGTDLFMDASQMQLLVETFATLNPELEGMSRNLQNAELSAQLMGGAAVEAADDLDEFGYAAQAASDAFKGFIDEAFGEINALTALGDAIYDLGEEFYNAGAEAAFSGPEMQKAIMAVYNADPANAAANLQAFYNYLRDVVNASVTDLQYLAAVMNSVGVATGPATLNFNSLGQAFDRARVAGRGAGGAARSAAKEVRTLLDYAKDLQGVMSRAFDLRFGTDNTMDAIRQTWRDINKEIEEAGRKINELTADKSIREYWLGVAEAYGDTLRAGVLRSEIEGLDAKITDEQAKYNKELTGTTEAAENNRERMQDLVKAYQNHITTMAENGATQAQLKQAAANLKAEFIAQATQMGYNTAEVMKYAASFDDMAVAINNVPRNITITTNTDPALQALAEFAAKARSTASGAGSTAGRVFGESFKAAMEATIRTARSNVVYSSGNDWNGRYGSGSISFHANGGMVPTYTGRGGKHTIAALAHAGEVIVPQRYVNQSTGKIKPEYVDRISSGHNPTRGYTQGGVVRPVGGSSAMLQVELNPAQAREFMKIMQEEKLVLMADDRTIARKANRGNRQLANEGVLNV